MTPDQVNEELLLRVELCPWETNVPLFFMTGSRRCDADKDANKRQHHPEGPRAPHRKWHELLIS